MFGKSHCPWLPTLESAADEELSETVINLLINIFELLPMVCIVDKQIFVAHSGIPKSIPSTYQIKTVATWSQLASANKNHSKIYNNYYNYNQRPEDGSEMNEQSWFPIDKTVLFDEVLDELLQVM